MKVLSDAAVPLAEGAAGDGRPTPPEPLNPGTVRRPGWLVSLHPAKGGVGEGYALPGCDWRKKAPKQGLEGGIGENGITGRCLVRLRPVSCGSAGKMEVSGFPVEP